MRPDYSISILVVDDDAMVKSILVDYLCELGFSHITEAKNPDHALKLIQDNKFRCEFVISDWEMPRVTGLTLLKAIRKNPIRRHTPFMMVTSQRSMERMKITQAAQWSVNAYILKPFGISLFREKIFEAMGWDDEGDMAI